MPPSDDAYPRDGLIVLGTLTPKNEMRAEAWSGADLYVSEQRPAESEDG